MPTIFDAPSPLRTLLWRWILRRRLLPARPAAARAPTPEPKAAPPPPAASAPPGDPAPRKAAPSPDAFIFHAPSAGASDAARVAPEGDAAPWITDFDPAEEAIELTWQSEDGRPPPDLSITISEWATELRLDGEVVARLAAGTRLERDDVRMVRAA